MGKAGNLQKIGKGLRLGIDQHLAHKRRAELRQRKRTRLRVNVFRRYAKRLRRVEESHDLRIAHGNLHHGNTGVFLEIVINGRHIVAELVKLADRIVDGMEIEVRRNVVGVLVVGRMLHRA